MTADQTQRAPRLGLDRLSRSFDGRLVVDDVSIDVAPGEIVCLLGPSGCGKSTTLRMAAGVERQDTGAVRVDGRTVSEGDLHLPPEARFVGLMFQDFALFPHLSVAENVGFGLRRMRMSARRDLVAQYLGKVGLAGYAAKYPHQLSGGEQQRVALARALAPKPRVMLMDEPFSGLDMRLRDEVRDEALAILKAEGAGVLLVTHEPEEAMRMADRIALMREGRIVQTGAPYHIYNYPVDRQAAAFFSDINVIHGIAASRQIETAFGRFLAPGMADGADVEVIIRPQHLEIDQGQDAPEPSAQKGVSARGTVERARFMGNESLIEVRMEHDSQRLAVTRPGVFLPEPGTPLWLSFRRDHCFVFPCAKQSRLASPWAAE